MRLPLGPADARRLARMSDEEFRAFIAKCRPQDILVLDAQFELWAQEGQLPPSCEGWRVWLMMAGRGFGKTRAGAEWVHRLACTGRKSIALIGATIEEARRVMVEGVSGLLTIARRERISVKWEASLGRITWPTGSVAHLFSGDNADGLRGPEHHFAWADELAKWRQATGAWHNLQLGLRAGPRPRALVTTTPRSIQLLQDIAAQQWTVKTGGRTDDNINLPSAFVDVMRASYGGTRLGRQELDGELIADIAGSLWPRAMIEQSRATPPEQFDRVVVGVDPPAGVGEDCNACGIVVAAKAGDRYYVLADESVQGLSPEGWARAVADAADRWSADRVVAEANNGGAMVRSCLKAADAGLEPRLVHASRGKVARAEPVALRFEAGTAFLGGMFPELEDEMSGLIAGGGYQGPGDSPDRADAMVWALTELAETRTGRPRIRAL